jgi:anthranilate synthase component I
MESLDFKQFQVKTTTYKYQDFPCVIEEIPIRVIPHLEKQSETFCFLESAVYSQSKGQYSILAFGVHSVISGEDIFDDINTVLTKITHLANEDLPMIGSLYGYIAYNAVKRIEPSINCGDASLIPEGFMFLPKNIVIIDNIRSIVHIASIYTQEHNIEEVYAFIQNAIKEQLSYIPSTNTQEYSDCFHENVGFYSNISKEDYCKMVEKSIDYIKKGDIFQIVPSIRFYKQYNKHPIEFYQQLKRINPSPYMFYFSSLNNGERFNIIGASPEILINCKNNEITLKPLAGTIKRGSNEEEDEENARELLANEKEIAEHLMLLDLGRNDVGRVGDEIHVERQMEIEKYSHVMHISSTVKGKKRGDVTMVDVLKSGLPAGTLSGAPKIRAMQIIAELETVTRDFYAGTVGYISSTILQTCIVLRSALITNGTMYTQAGAGVVFDSIPEKEYEECIHKITAIAKASE